MKNRPRALNVFAAVLLVGVLHIGSAGAALVSVTGGFLSYSGPTGFDDVSVLGITGAQTLVNGNVVMPTAPIPGFEAFPGIGTAVVPFGSAVPSVEFWIVRDDPANPGTQIEDLRNFIGFAPAAPQSVSAAGQEFLLGTFSLQNGTFWAFADLTLRFRLTTVSSDPTLNGHVFEDTLQWVTTPNGGPPLTPADRADFFYFLGHPGLGTMRVFEAFDGTNTGTIDLYGRIGSLIPTRFADATGGAFIGPGIPTAVPGPATPFLLVLGCGLLALVRRRAA